MEAIFASKLYKTSTRKGKIAAALADPINVELVQQLQEYLNQPDDVQNALDKTDAVAEKDSASAENTDAISAPNMPEHQATDRVPARSVPGSKSTGFISDDGAELTSDSVKSEDATAETPDANQVIQPEPTDNESSDDNFEDVPLNRFHALAKEEENNGDEVKESTAIESATALYQSPVKADCCPCSLVDADLIKGTLNARVDTKGASRIFVKDSEMWIYYEDAINLNSVMEPVIHLLNAEGFNHFEFSRLARSKNAIVFDIVCIPEPLEPISKEDEK